MIYTVQNTSKIGKPVDYILDADGNQIDGQSVACDTETGEVTQHVLDQAGVPVVDPTGTAVMTVTRHFKPPLKVVFRQIAGCRET
jgi:hypothetical protein